MAKISSLKVDLDVRQRLSRDHLIIKKSSMKSQKKEALRKG